MPGIDFAPWDLRWIVLIHCEKILKNNDHVHDHIINDHYFICFCLHESLETIVWLVYMIQI